MIYGTPNRKGLAATNAAIIDQAFDADVSPAEKTRATLAAELALAGGYVLLQLADESWLVTRWNASWHCPDLQTVARFVRQVRGY